MKYHNDLSERTIQYASEVILFLRTVKSTPESIDIKRQLVRSATSVGANFEESEGAKSKADIRNKISLTLKELRESIFFLKVMDKLEMGNTKKCQALIQESSELKRIFGTILNKL